MANTQDELWKVTNVVDTQMFLPGQGAVAAKKVTFVTSTGATSSVDIPDSEFDAESVSTTIHNAAVKIIQVQALRGPSMQVFPEPLGFEPFVAENG